MRYTLISILLFFVGCATTPVPSSEATPVPPSKHLLFKQPGANTAPVLVIRDSGWSGAACDTKIFVNGQLAARLSTSEKVTLHIPAGEVILGIEPNCLAALAGLLERSATLVAGKPSYFRVGYDTGGQSLQPTMLR